MACMLMLGSFLVHAAWAQIEVRPGPGAFSMAGGADHPNATITVYYHRPTGFDATSPILIVVPGDGRNGDEYRDSWINASEEYGVLVLSPSYPEDDYDPAAYHLGGVIENLELRNLNTGTPGVFRLADEDIVYDVNPEQERWLFRDFDRLFDNVVEAIGSTQSEYDLFGHSAGGQIVHRMAIFYPESKARWMIAANSGFYTVPDVSTRLIFGVANAPLTVEDLKRGFSQPLTLLLGEFDDAYEPRGQHLSTPLADSRGIGRLARGQYFYRSSQAIARELDASFNWTIEVVPGVGHDFRSMADAAASLLYNESEVASD
jgi:pimeloyl-ACP methyl ester carboxylesterase